MGIESFFENGKCQIDALGAYFDGLDQPTRIKESTNLTPKQQRALWDAAEGGERLDMNYFVPADKGPLEEVKHWGQNSLPAFNHFQKVMCRTSDPSGFSGYNISSAMVFVGVGYYVARETTEADDDNQGIVIDYTKVPTEKCEHWPEIPKSGNNRLGSLVYGGNLDYMRRVSKHVSIGRAKKPNTPKWMPAWFMLCRED